MQTKNKLTKDQKEKLLTNNFIFQNNYIYRVSNKGIVSVSIRKENVEVFLRLNSIKEGWAAQTFLWKDIDNAINLAISLIKEIK